MSCVCPPWAGSSRSLTGRLHHCSSSVSTEDRLVTLIFSDAHLHSCLCKAGSSLLVIRTCMHAKLLQSCDPMDYCPPESMGFSRQEYWSGLLCPSPADLPNLGIEPPSLTSPAWEVGSLPLLPPGKPSLHLGYLWIWSTSMLPIRRAGSITLKVLSIKYQIAVSSGRQSRQPPNWRAWSFCFSVLKLTLNDTLIPVLQNLANSALHLNTL